VVGPTRNSTSVLGFGGVIWNTWLSGGMRGRAFSFQGLRTGLEPFAEQITKHECNDWKGSIGNQQTEDKGERVWSLVGNLFMNA